MLLREVAASATEDLKINTRLAELGLNDIPHLVSADAQAARSLP
jgi:hypothetical protein